MTRLRLRGAKSGGEFHSRVRGCGWQHRTCPFPTLVRGHRGSVSESSCCYPNFRIALGCVRCCWFYCRAGREHPPWLLLAGGSFGGALPTSSPVSVGFDIAQAKRAAFVQFPTNFIKPKVKTCNKVVGFFFSHFSFYFFLLKMSSGKACGIFQNLGEHRAPLFLISCVVFNCYYA